MSYVSTFVFTFVKLNERDSIKSLIPFTTVNFKFEPF